MSSPTVELPSGDAMPVIGFGTWDLSGNTARESVQTAIEMGYTHIDTAEGYSNEADIGAVIREYDRDELFITSKVSPANLNYESVISHCVDSIEKLSTEYLDLYLIHWPNPAISLRETFHAMEKLLESGRVKNVGVSNFSAYQLGVAHHISDVPIAVNQIEYHPLFQRPELVDYCKETDSIVAAAAPLARTKILDDDTVTELAEIYGKTPAQIVLNWIISNDIVALPKSSNPEHIRDNIAIFDWELDPADKNRLDELDRREPVYFTPPGDLSDYIAP